MEDQRDEKLWKIATKRAKFRRRLYFYVVINTLLWIVWWFTAGKFGDFDRMPWPVWPMIGLGLFLAFQYYNAYHSDQSDLAEKEYEKLKNERR